jgi:hypothetical protein
VFPLSGAIATKVLSYGAGRDDRGQIYQSLHIGVGTRHVCAAHTLRLLASLACTDMASKTRMTERLSTSHMLIVIERTQSTFAAMPSAVTIGGGVVN